jgi:hypothetical protein
LKKFASITALTLLLASIPACDPELYMNDTQRMNYEYNKMLTNTISFEKALIEPGFPITKTLAAGFSDQRPYVIKSGGPASYLGNIYQILLPEETVSTTSGKPLAIEFTRGMIYSAKMLGIPFSPLKVSSYTPEEEVLDDFALLGKQRLLLFTINKFRVWENIGFSKIDYRVFYDLSLAVYDSSGHKCAQSMVADSAKKTSKELFPSPTNLSDFTRDVYKTQVKKLLNNDSVKACLQ